MDVVGKTAVVVDGPGEIVSDTPLVINDKLDVECARHEEYPCGPGIRGRTVIQ